MDVIKPYYMNQDGWGMNEYYSLHRYLHRLILHSDKKKDEIQSMDVKQMSDRTKVLMYCIIKYYKREYLMDSNNLNQLRNCKPLTEPLILGNLNLDVPEYNEMNVLL